jgi:translin
VDLGPIAEPIRARLDAKMGGREKALPASRDAIRFCANSIRATHRGDTALAEELMGKAREKLDVAQSALKEFPDVYHAGFLSDAEKEYAEAKLTAALIAGKPLPGPDDIRVGDAAYLNGMTEAIGELRRHVLDIMRHGNLERGEELLQAMDDIYYMLISIDYPDAITGGLRRSTDVARSIMERTRSDLSLTLVQRNLQDAIAEHQKRIEG